MNKLVYLLFVVIFVVDWNLGVLPRALKLAPEMVSMLAAIIVLALFVTQKRLVIDPKYLLLFFILFLHILIGIIISQVQPGAIVSGLRIYLKHIPFFLLPAVYFFSDEEIVKQLKLLFVLVLFQFPVAIYQRFFQFAGDRSGDAVGGTLGNSKVMSVTLLCAIAVVFAFYLRKKIGIKRFVVLSLVLLTPSAINETAGTFFLMPFAFLAPALLSDLGKNRVRNILITIVGGGLLLIGFAAIYDVYYGQRWGQGGGIASLIFEGKALEYETESQPNEGEGSRVGRIASITNSFGELWNLDPLLLIVGVGIGNASQSFSGVLSGYYYERYWHTGISTSTLSQFMWELGLFGTLLFYLFLYFIYRDARALRFRDNITGILALGWLGVLSVFTVSTIYMNNVYPHVLGYLVAYISGYLAARRKWADHRQSPGKSTAISKSSI